MIAFTEAIAEQVGEEARWFHYGLTSSDVVDTGLALQLRAAGAEVLAGCDRALAAVLERALEHRATPCMGRTHGVHAEPTTFGLKLLGWWYELRRGRERVERAFDGVSVGKLSGAVGAYGNVDPRVEDLVLAELGLGREDVATQVVARDRHAELLAALAILGSSLDRFATEIRHLQRSEVREAAEPFARGPEGLLGDAAQAQPDHLRAHQRPGARAARQRRRRLRERAAVARARHLALLGRARRADRLDDARALPARPLRLGRRGARGLSRAHAPQHRRGARADVLGSRPARARRGRACRARPPTRSCSATPCAPSRRRLPLRQLLEADPEAAALLDAATLDRIFDLDAALRNAGVAFDRLEAAHV